MALQRGDGDGMKGIRHRLHNQKKLLIRIKI